MALVINALKLLERAARLATIVKPTGNREGGKCDAFLTLATTIEGAFSSISEAKELFTVSPGLYAYFYKRTISRICPKCGRCEQTS